MSAPTAAAHYPPAQIRKDWREESRVHGRLVRVLVVLLLAGCDTTPDLDRAILARSPTPASASPASPDLNDVNDINDTDTLDTVITDTDAADTSVHDVEDVQDLQDSPDLQDTQDTTPADTTPADTTPADTTPADTTLADTTPADIFTPDTTPTTGEPCQVGTVTGTCRHLSECEGDEAAIEGFCDGHPQVRCCLPARDRCSSTSRPGACLTATDCPSPDWATSAGLCPGPADIRCCTSSAPAPACDPSIRPDPNGVLTAEDEEAGDPGCPRGMALITPPTTPAAFCIDRFEASLVLDTSSASAWTHHSPYHNPGSTAVRAVSLRYAVPQGYIDQVRAKAACERANKRLCTSAEWLFACQGSAQNTYPYGPTRQPGVCNDDRRQHVAVEFFPNDPNRFSKINNACLSQLPNSVDLNGENPGCVTANGVYDLMGNVHEWIDDPAGTFRGGFFDDTTINGNGCLYRTTAHDVNHWDYSTGFRCCATP